MSHTPLTVIMLEPCNSQSQLRQLALKWSTWRPSYSCTHLVLPGNTPDHQTMGRAETSDLYWMDENSCLLDDIALSHTATSQGADDKHDGFILEARFVDAYDVNLWYFRMNLCNWFTNNICCIALNHCLLIIHITSFRKTSDRNQAAYLQRTKWNIEKLFRMGLI